MKYKKFLLSVFYKPIQINILNPADFIKVNIHRLARVKFVPNKLNMLLIFEYNKIKLFKIRFYIDKKIKLKKNIVFETFAFQQIFEKQYDLFKKLIEEKGKERDERIFEKLKTKLSFNEIRTINNSINNKNNKTQYLSIIALLAIHLFVALTILLVFKLNHP